MAHHPPRWPRRLLVILLSAQFLFGALCFLAAFGRSIKGLESRTMTAAFEAVDILVAEGRMQLPDTERAEWFVARRFADAAKTEGLDYAMIAIQASFAMSASAAIAAAILLADRVMHRRAARAPAEA